MGFLTNLFGGETNIWTISFALIIVIVLIIAGVWLLKVLANASGTIARGKQRRLSLVDTIAIDNKRNLVLIRRDDVEHLLVISGNTETVVETGIQNDPASESRIEPKAPATKAPITKEAPNPLAQTSLAAAAVGAATTKPAPVRRTAHSATKSTRERFGLSRLLRRAAKPDSEPKIEHPAPLDFPAKENSAPVVEVKKNDTRTDKYSPPFPPRAMANGAPQENPDTDNTLKKSGPALRHKGLLMPISEMVETGVSVEKSANEDNSKPLDTDSDMKKAEEIDDHAMASIEEGADSGDENIKATPDNDDESVSVNDGKSFDNIEELPDTGDESHDTDASATNTDPDTKDTSDSQNTPASDTDNDKDEHDNDDDKDTRDLSDTNEPNDTENADKKAR